MGVDINVHDQWAIESMGTIQDRSREHLARSDTAIRAYRSLLLQAIATVEAGDRLTPEGSFLAAQAPIAVDAIASGVGWQDHWRTIDAERRQSSPWARVDEDCLTKKKIETGDEYE